MAENTVVALDHTEANFNGFGSNSFPLDTNGLQDLQANAQLLSVLGNIGGNQYILTGVDLTGATYSAGYVFLSTTLQPQGELLYLASGSDPNIYIDETYDNITASGYPFDKAYKHRRMLHGTGALSGTSYNLNNFKKLTTNADLATQISELSEAIKAKGSEDIGSMKFWPTLTIPNNWMLCDGRLLDKDEYQALYLIIGTTYGESGNSFNLPDPRARFPVAYKKDDGDFGNPGRYGGDRSHALSEDEMPYHNHSTRVSSYASGTYEGYNYYMFATESKNALWEKNDRTMGYTGKGQAHTNIPPYYVFPFIIKVK